MKPLALSPPSRVNGQGSNRLGLGSAPKESKRFSLEPPHPLEPPRPLDVIVSARSQEDGDSGDEAVTHTTSSALGAPGLGLSSKLSGGGPISLAEVSALRKQLGHLESLCNAQKQLLAEQRLAAGVQQAQAEWAAAEGVQALLGKLQPPTLKAALGDLGLPAADALSKAELAARLAEAVQPQVKLG